MIIESTKALLPGEWYKDQCHGVPASQGKEDPNHESGDESLPLDTETAKAIVTQVENYFMDENLRKDAFLLKHIKRNRDGFVSLKLITSLRRVKSLTKNWKDVATAIRSGSNDLILNSESTKVKRVSLLPLDLLLMSRGKRIVLVYGLGKASVSTVSSAFHGLGNMASIRLFTQKEDSEYITRIYPTVNPLSSALIEFESVSEAEKALQAMYKRPVSWRSTIGAVAFGNPIPHKRPPSFQRNNESKNVSKNWCSDSPRPRSRTLSETSPDQMFPLHRKSRSCNGIQVTEVGGRKTQVHRQPLGPDGTRGFRKRD